MRTIKFRQWDKNGGGGMWFWDVENGADFDLLTELEKQTMPIMQFTGLKDKNGKEIYEGDIVSYPNEKYDPSEGDSPDSIKAIEWGLGCFTTGEYELWELMMDNPCEVIGNIYENPELLTQ